MYSDVADTLAIEMVKYSFQFAGNPLTRSGQGGPVGDHFKEFPLYIDFYVNSMQDVWR